MKRTKTEVITQICREVNQDDQQVKDFQQLSEDVLRYRSNPNQWSVLDCLEHINMFYADYFSRMEPAIRRASPSDCTVYTPGFIAQKMVDGLRPQRNRRRMKIKTFARMTPATDDKSSTLIFSAYFQYHAQLKQLLEQSKALNWNRVKVASAIGSILRFKLGDCFQLLTAHTERHLLQCQEVLSARPEKQHV